MSQNLTASIVRILGPNGNTVGTGFVVTKDGLIATCAHVVQAVGAGPGDRVRLAFHATGSEREVRVEPEWWHAPDAGDVAIMRLEGPLPEGVIPLPLGGSAGVEGHPLSTFGFPHPKPVEGMAGKGEVVGRTTDRGFPVLQLRSTEVTPGFSGAPVWDHVTRRVVGMVTAITAPDRYGRLVETAFIIPTETLRAVCPVLQISDVCPYRGLDAFTEDDAGFFFGRQRAVERLLESLRREPRFLAVLGPSGSGKSSLVQAGLFPRLRQGAVPGSNKWGIIVARPADQPFRQLEAQGLRGAAAGLVAAVKAWLKEHQRERLVLVVDQFEELLVTCAGEVRRDFVAQLSGLLESPLRVTVILVMRDDFYSRFVREAGALVPWLERALVNVPLTLEREELEAIVEEPAKAVGLAFESGLAEAIVEDVLKSAPKGEEVHSTILPLLEFALTQLWDRRQEGMLTHDAYRSIGGVTGSLTQWADRAFYGLDEEQRRLARRVLTDLVHLGDERQGLPDSRRRRTLNELCRSEGEREAVHGVVRALANARLLVTGRDLSTRQETVELIHDALLQEWELLRGWLREDRRFLTWRQAMEGRMQVWVETAPDDPQKRDAGRLLRGRELAEALDWLERRQDEMESELQRFIRQSHEYAEAERRARERLRRRITLGLAAGLVITLLLAFFAWTQRNQAVTEADMRATAQAQAEERRQQAEAAQATAIAEAGIRATAQAQAEERRQEAEEQRQIAVSQQLATRAQLLYTESGNLVTSVLLAAESLRYHSNLEAGLFLQRTIDQLQRPLSRLEHEKEIISAAFSLDNRLLFVATSDGVIHIWDWVAQKEIGLLVHAEPVKRTVLSPDGHVLATVTDGGVRFWDITVGQVIMDLKFEQLATLLEFSPDWRWMAVVNQGDSKSVNIWDLSSGQPTVQLIHEDGIDSIAFSPDSRWLATSSGSTVRVWGVATGREVSSRKSNLTGTRGIFTFSPDSKLIASSWINDTVVEVWEVSTGREVAKMVYDRGVGPMKFTPDGKMFIIGVSGGGVIDPNIRRGSWGVGGSSGGIERVIEIWQVKDWQKMGVTTAPLGNIFEIHPKVPLVASGQNDEWVYIWNLYSGRVIAKIEMPKDINRVRWDPADHPAWIAAVMTEGPCEIWDISTGHSLARLSGASRNQSYEFSHDSKYLVGWDFGGNTALIWELEPKQYVALKTADFLMGIPSVVEVHFSPDGKWMVATLDNVVKLWKVPDGGIEAETWLSWWWGDEIMSSAYDIAFSFNGRWIASGGPDSTARVWDASTGQEVSRMIHGAEVYAVAFSPDGRFLVSGSADCTARVWESLTGREISRITHEDAVHNVAFSPDGQLALSADEHTIRVWESLTGQEIFRITYEDQIRDVIFSEDGRLVLSAGGHMTRIWEVATGKEISRIIYKNQLSSVAFSPDGKLIISAEWDDKKFRFWDTLSGKELVEFESAGVVSGAKFSFDGKLALGVDHDVVHVWDISTMSERFKLKHTGSIYLAIFSPDGRYILISGFDGRTLVWETSTGQIIAELWQPSFLVRAASFSPDGRRVAMVGADNNMIRVVLWRPQDLITEACRRLPRNLTREEWARYVGPDVPYRPTCPNLPVPGE